MMNENTVTVNALRAILRNLNMKTSGRKEELIQRLNDYCDVVVKDDLIILIKDGIEAQYDMSGKHIMDTEVEVTDWTEGFAQAWVDEEDEPIPVPVVDVQAEPKHESVPHPDKVESIKYIGMDGAIHLFKYRKMDKDVYKSQLEKCKQQFSADAVMLFKDQVLGKWIIKTSHGLFYDLDKNIIGQVMAAKPQNTPAEEAAEKAVEEILEDIAAECPVKGHKDIDAECGSKIRTAINEAKVAHETTKEWEKVNKTKAPNHMPEDPQAKATYNADAIVGAQNEVLDPLSIWIWEEGYKATYKVVSGLRKLFKKKG